MFINNNNNLSLRMVAGMQIFWYVMENGYLKLTHFSLETQKRGIGKQCRPRSDTTERGVLSGSTLFELNTGIAIKHSNKKKLARHTTCIINRPVQRVVIEKWAVAYQHCIFTLNIRTTELLIIPILNSEQVHLTVC